MMNLCSGFGALVALLHRESFPDLPRDRPGGALVPGVACSLLTPSYTTDMVRFRSTFDGP